MDSYLDIAEHVLGVERRPLRPLSILEEGYRLGIVPAHLYGETQHKTLQARISEDIVHQKDKSRFFRTEPGKFFLRKFLTDTSIPERYRQPVNTKRRKRELKPSLALAVNQDMLQKTFGGAREVEASDFFKFLDRQETIFVDPRNPDGWTFVWGFSLVRQHSSYLTYRSGKYRVACDSLAMQRSVGFWSMVAPEFQTLFNPRGLGVADAAINAAKLDLDILGPDANILIDELHSRVEYFSIVNTSEQSMAVLGVVNYSCPFWFEPTKRRLSLHDVSWMSRQDVPNNLDDFDPWSQRIIETEFELAT